MSVRGQNRNWRPAASMSASHSTADIHHQAFDVRWCLALVADGIGQAAVQARRFTPAREIRNSGCARLGRRHGDRDLRSVSGHGQRFASHQFDCWPVLAEKVRCVVEIASLHSNTAGLSAGAVRYLKVKIEADCLRLLIDRLIIAAHLVSPPFCVAHFTLTIWIFVGPDCGAPCQKLRRPAKAAWIIQNGSTH